MKCCHETTSTKTFPTETALIEHYCKTANLKKPSAPLTRTTTSLMHFNQGLLAETAVKALPTIANQPQRKEAERNQLVLIKRYNVQICTKPPNGWLTVLTASPARAHGLRFTNENRHPAAAGCSHWTTCTQVKFELLQNCCAVPIDPHQFHISVLARTLAPAAITCTKGVLAGSSRRPGLLTSPITFTEIN